MLSLREMERAASILGRTATGCRIQGIVQPDATSIVLELYASAREGEGRRFHVLLSCHPETARVSAPERARNAPGGPPRFAQWLRAHLKGARVERVSMVDGDRQLALDVRRGEGDYRLLLAIFGRRSNVVVIDGQGRIVDALRPLAETRPELSPGGPWTAPASTTPRAGEDRFAGIDDADYLASVEAHYSGAEADGAFADRGRKLAQALRKERKSAERKLARLDQELAGAEADTGLERMGELLKSALDRVSRGDTEVVVRDWDSGEEVTIALDPAKSPAENLERLFKRYRKAVRTLTKGGAQRAAVHESHVSILTLEQELADGIESGAADALEALAARADVARLLGKHASRPPPARKSGTDERFRKIGKLEVPAKFVPRRYRTECGLEVWVGRSDAANDYLSTRLARGRDLFFHLDGAPGSHVILRTEGRTDPPQEAVLDACELAVHFSKQKNASRADVHVVPIHNVKKPKGAKPGLVYVTGGKSVHLRRTPARLERILAARIEEA